MVPASFAFLFFYYLVAAVADEALINFDGYAAHAQLPVHRELPFTIPSSGFITAKTISGEPRMFNIMKRINEPHLCRKIQYLNLPDPNPSPLVGGSLFTLMSNKLVNDHYVWTNGLEFISYIEIPDSKYGNWLLGNEPGVDSGYVFLRTDKVTLSPLNATSASAKWKWLMKGKWVPQENIELVCMDDYNVGTYYFEVEYFDHKTGEAHESWLIPDLNPIILDAVEQHDANGKQQKILSAVLHKKEMKWEQLEGIEWLASEGHPVLIGQGSNGILSSLGLSVRTTAMLVAKEHANNKQWRLTFRKHNNSRAPFVYDNPEEDDEFLIEVGATGVNGGRYVISQLSASQLHSFRRSWISEMRDMHVGEYAWIWFDDVHGNAVKTSQSLVQCVAKDGSALVFRVYPADRVEQMREKVLTHVTSLLTVSLDSVGDVVRANLGSKQLQIASSISIGSDIYGFIRRYIVTKEGKPNGMSSCYFYHAAVSLPQSLIYAAEIMCVLMGYKPLTLVRIPCCLHATSATY
jgi:hypothetical protein